MCIFMTAISSVIGYNFLLILSKSANFLNTPTGSSAMRAQHACVTWQEVYTWLNGVPSSHLLLHSHNDVLPKLLYSLSREGYCITTCLHQELMATMWYNNVRAHSEQDYV